ncbi:MAG: hypothetical protein ABFD61_02835 [Chloroherpetonaceae bacterium]|nr:hypothetical protein [bacterium]
MECISAFPTSHIATQSPSKVVITSDHSCGTISFFLLDCVGTDFHRNDCVPYITYYNVIIQIIKITQPFS